MRKLCAVTAGVLVFIFAVAAVFAATGLDVATPQNDEQRQEQMSGQAGQPTAGPAGISSRNKAKLEVEQSKTLRRDTILQERSAETASQSQQ